VKRFIVKRFLAACFFPLFFAGQAHAFQSTIWLSSNVPTAVSTTTLCTPTNYVVSGTTYTEGGHGVLHGVCVNTAAAGNVQVFNSSATAANSITGLYSTATQVPCNFYDVGISSGLSYDKNGTADITILYQCY
jgi:hypothetical protein